MNERYQEELFYKLLQHPSWKNEIEAFNRIIGRAVWLLLPATFNFRTGFKKLIRLKKDIDELNLSLIKKALHGAKKSGRVQTFRDKNGEFYYCVPITRGEQIYGYAGIFKLEQPINEQMTELFNAFTCTTVETVQKELEVSKLYETIRPKTIALSTVHTISRILSSTLDIDELLPRIARLSLQVLRAKRCSIMLLDKYKKNLIPKAVVDISKKHLKSEPIRIEKSLPGKAIKEGRVIMRPKFLCVPLVSEEHIIGAISISQRLDNKPFTIFDREILTTLSEQAVIAIKNAQLYDEQEKLTLNSIKAFASILSSGVADNYGRTNLFINITMSLGMELKLRSDQMRMLYYASLLHNVSQMGVPDKILKKSTKLTGKDYRIIREQHLKGTELIKPIGGRLKAVLPIIIHHHERYNGTGYPSGLRGEDIPLGSRILAVADSFEAMLSKRPYRRKLSISQAVVEIVKHSGEQFDPIIVDAFVRVIKRYKNKILKTRKNAWIWKKL